MRDTGGNRDGEYQQALAIAKDKGLRIFAKRGTYRVYRNTLPKLTFIGERVNAHSLLDLVTKAAGSWVMA